MLSITAWAKCYVKIMVHNITTVLHNAALWTTLIFTSAVECNSVTSFVVGENRVIVACRRRTQAEMERCTMCSELEVTCNLMKCPETDVWMKWYVEVTCLNANKSVTAPRQRENRKSKFRKLVNGVLIIVPLPFSNIQHVFSR
jgi:hypothetical protein